MAVRITRKDKSAGELRQEAARCRDGKAARRMLAIALAGGLLFWMRVDRKSGGSLSQNWDLRARNV